MTVDLFADALWHFYQTGRARLYTERDDGFRQVEDISWYFTRYRNFPRHERESLTFAHGRVLDLGCGAGRHALYFQHQGLAVTAVDISAHLVELARQRGVKDVRCANVCRKLPFGKGEFDTVILMGNNLGICGSVRGVERMLGECYRVTTSRGRILATTRAPDARDPRTLKYLQENLKKGCPAGHVRLRLIFNGKRGQWFDLLLLSPTDLMALAVKAKWQVKCVLPLGTVEEGYAAVMEKT